MDVGCAARPFSLSAPSPSLPVALSMLLIFFIIHTFAKKTEAGHTDVFGFRSTSDTCDCNIDNCRRLFDIVWGCLTTIFACTWVSVHPNVPPPNTSGLGLLSRRLKLMLVAIIAPEVMVNFAARQFFAARRFSKDFDMSQTHGFFLCMGGFVAKDPSTGSPGCPIVTREQLEQPQCLAAIKQVPVADIKDKSKGDALSKGVALAQGTWFVAQCMARLAQRLPVAELEVTTFAFAVVNIFVWLLWWGKPLDVQEPISIGAPFEETPTASQSTPVWTFGDRFVEIFVGDYNGYNPLSSTSVPSFWSESINDNEDAMTREYPILTQIFLGAIFGAIHFMAWSADFTSSFEKLMWRFSALVVTAVPLLLFALATMALVVTSFASAPSVKPTAFLAVFTYIIARLFLLVIPFAALRALPAGAFIDVDWSVYIPHL